MKSFFRVLVFASMFAPFGLNSATPVRGQDVDPQTNDWVLRMLALGDEVPEDKMLRAQALPVLRGVLKNPTYTDPRLRPENPIPMAAQAIRWLTEIAPGELVPYLELTKHPDEEIRRLMFEGLAGSLDAKAVPVLAGVIAKEREGLGGDVLARIGDQITYHRRRPPADFVDRLWPHLEADVARGDQTPSSAQLLCLLDRDRAQKFLCSEAVLTLKSPSLSEVLEALEKHELEVPSEQLLPLVQEFVTLPREPDRHFNVLRFGIRLLAAKKHPWVKKWIDQELADGPPKALPRNAGEAEKKKHQDRGYRYRTAAYALMRYEGITGEVFDSVRDRPEFDQLTEPQKHVAAACQYHYSMSASGHENVYSSSTARYLDQMEPALRAVGAERHLKILEAANATWGKLNPAKNFTEFHRRNPDPTEEQLAKFKELDERESELEEYEPLITTLEIYAAKHAEHFREFLRRTVPGSK
jgi:hypothetical protein